MASFLEMVSNTFITIQQRYKLVLKLLIDVQIKMIVYGSLLIVYLLEVYMHGLIQTELTIKKYSPKIELLL